MNQTDILRATEPVVNAFESLNISYYISGSVASSSYGNALDIAYLENWAVELQLDKLLQRAFDEANITKSR